jgi:hypothetical protein
VTHGVEQTDWPLTVLGGSHRLTHSGANGT